MFLIMSTERGTHKLQRHQPFPGCCQDPFFQAAQTDLLGSVCPSLWGACLMMGEQLLLATSSMCAGLPLSEGRVKFCSPRGNSVGSLRSPLHSKAGGKRKKKHKNSCDKFLTLPHTSFAGQQTQISDKERTVQLPSKRVIQADCPVNA